MQPISGVQLFPEISVEQLVLEEPVDIVMAMSLLHLVEDKRAVIKHIYDWLKPGGTFVSSTVCLGENYWIFKYLGPIGHFFGLLPHLDIFTPEELKSCLIECGFEIEYAWRPEKGPTVFYVARKPE